ncbi:MAG: hypothetical protein AABY68_05990 [Pseudomonadota bacterium]
MSAFPIQRDAIRTEYREFTGATGCPNMLIAMIDGEAWYAFAALPDAFKAAYAEAKNLSGGKVNRLIRYEGKIHSMTPAATANWMGQLTLDASEALRHWQHEVVMPWVKSTRRRQRAAIQRAARRAA